MKSRLRIFVLFIILLTTAVAVSALADADKSGSAEEPYLIGMLDAGYRIYYGKAVPPYLDQDYDAAFPYASEAADMGVPEAENMMGNMYQNGLGTEKDLEWAFFYYQCASVHGAFAAPLNLSQFYAQGIGTEKDQEKADYWRNVYDEIQANPPERNSIISQDEVANLASDRKAIIVDAAELYISSWEALDDYAYRIDADDGASSYALTSGAEEKLIAVRLYYKNLIDYALLYDDYITYVSLVYDGKTSFDRDIHTVQFSPKENKYFDVWSMIAPGDEILLVYIFTVPNSVAQSDAPLTFNLRFNGNPISFILR